MSVISCQQEISNLTILKTSQFATLNLLINSSLLVTHYFLLAYCLLIPKPQLIQSLLHFGGRHKKVPEQAGAIILYHDDDRTLVDGDI